MVSNCEDEKDLQTCWGPMRTNFGRNRERWQVYAQRNFIFEIRKTVSELLMSAHFINNSVSNTDKRAIL